METSDHIMIAVRPDEWLTLVGPDQRILPRTYFSEIQEVSSVAAFAHSQGVLVHQYLDDWLLGAQTSLISKEITAWLES